MSNSKIFITYFSGTGNTQRVATTIENAFLEHGVTATLYSLGDTPGCAQPSLEDVDWLVLLYPVYAFDAPDIVYDWLQNLPHGNNTKTAVLSVSGGGEVWPNTACRVNCIKKLENKGYCVVYEQMLVMPSNCLVRINDHLSMHLLNALPNKVKSIVTDITADKTGRTGYRFGVKVAQLMSKIEKRYQERFARSIKAKDSCTSCGWCEANCPTNNIKQIGDRPSFGTRCIICLRCIYGCPNRALYSDKYDKMIFTEGYNLKSLETRMQGVDLKPVNECCKGILWAGVRKYLANSR